jgi:hypothetical protein
MTTLTLSQAVKTEELDHALVQTAARMLAAQRVRRNVLCAYEKCQEGPGKTRKLIEGAVGRRRFCCPKCSNRAYEEAHPEMRLKRKERAAALSAEPEQSPIAA